MTPTYYNSTILMINGEIISPHIYRYWAMTTAFYARLNRYSLINLKTRLSWNLSQK